MLFQATNISPDDVNNTGAADLSQGLDVSWQVNGSSAMTGYRINIYTNDVSSTQLYSTGQVTLDTPFWGTNYAGQVQYFQVNIPAATLSAANISNGHEYKLSITQWWNGGSVTQTTASVFMGRTQPELSIVNVPAPLTAYQYSFQGSYYQAENEPIKWLRWQIATLTGGTRNVFMDTGQISGTGELQVSYSGFLNDREYSILLELETISGIKASTGWTDFEVSYVMGSAVGAATACQKADESCVLVSWTQSFEAEGYAIYRQRSGDELLRLIAEVGNTASELRDYSACSGESYTYYIFPVGQYSLLSDAMISNTVAVKYWTWTIIEAASTGGKNYTAIKSYRFRMGAGGVNEGSFSNNNSPSITKNFTQYPTRQPEAANYLSGSVSGYIGSVNYPTVTYSDTLQQARALRYLSTSTNTIFLSDPKGHFLNIHTGSPVTVSVDHKKSAMPQTVSLPWIEVGATDDISLTSNPTSGFWPPDSVIFTTVYVDVATGQLMWQRDADYSNGSILSIEGTELVQSTGDGFTVAEMSIEENVLSAEL